MGSSTKVAIITVCALLLVAMVVTFIFARAEKKQTTTKISATQKAITKLCSNTDYNKTCVDSLESSGVNTTDPQQLIQATFKATIKDIKAAAENSTTLDEVEKDPRGKEALQSCRELADRAIADLERSLYKFKEFDLSHLDEFLSDLEIWLSGSITYQETCLDGFEGVKGDSGARMRKFLNTSMEMTSNGLAMVTGLSSIVGSIITGGQHVNSRRLLQLDALPTEDWISSAMRRFLEESDFDRKQIKPDLVVAKDGSGNFTTINEALPHVPKKSKETFTLYVKEGVYEEKVMINSSMKHLLMVGDGPTKTKITGKLNFKDGTNTYQTATVAVSGDHFTAVDIGFENSAGAEKHQAVALRVGADMAVFYNCQMDGYQDTLYAHTYRQFYRDCVISGTIDFIFGDSAAVFQNCKLVVRKPMENQQNIVTAQGRKDIRQPTGIVTQNCSFVADPAYFPLRKQLKSFLGRPWKEFSRTVIMESFIDDLIAPEGWLPWDRDFALTTLMYTEFNNRGPGSGKEQRLKWEGVKELPAKRVKRFTADKFVEGKKWVKTAKVPYEGKFMFEVPEDDPNVKYSPESPSETKDKGSIADKFFNKPDNDKSKDEKDKEKDKEKDEKEKEKEKEKEEKEKEKEKDKDKDKDKEKDEKEKEKDEGSSSSAKANPPTPAAKAASPAANAPTLAAKAPTPSAKAPSPAANAPTPAANATSLAAKAPTPAAKAPSPAAKAPNPGANAPSLAPMATPRVAAAPEGGISLPVKKF